MRECVRERKEGHTLVICEVKRRLSNSAPTAAAKSSRIAADFAGVMWPSLTLRTNLRADHMSANWGETGEVIVDEKNAL